MSLPLGVAVPQGVWIVAALAGTWLAYKVVAHTLKTSSVAVGSGIAGWIVGGTQWGAGPAPIVFGVVVGVVVYFLSTLRSPHSMCWWCGGNSKRKDGTGINFHLCPVCKGKGSRLRWGARVRPRYRSKEDK